MKFDLMLDAADPEFAKNLLEALGAKPGDEIVISTPQFARTDGRVITYFPRTKDEFAALHTFSEQTLTKLGLGIWDKDETQTHWLYPHEWYNYIPAGLMITSISGEAEQFIPGTTDDDMRFGCLAYGFIQKSDKEETTK